MSNSQLSVEMMETGGGGEEVGQENEEMDTTTEESEEEQMGKIFDNFYTEEVPPPSPLSSEDEDDKEVSRRFCAKVDKFIAKIRKQRKNVFDFIALDKAIACLNSGLGCMHMSHDREDCKHHMIACPFNAFSHCQDVACKNKWKKGCHIFKDLEEAIDHQLKVHGKPVVNSLEFEVSAEVINKPGIVFVGDLQVKGQDLCETKVAMFLRITRDGKMIPFQIVHGKSSLNPTELELNVEGIFMDSTPISKMTVQRSGATSRPFLPFYECCLESNVVEEASVGINDPGDYMFSAFTSLHSAIAGGKVMDPEGLTNVLYCKISEIVGQGMGKSGIRQDQRYLLMFVGKVQTYQLKMEAKYEFLAKIEESGYVNHWGKVIPCQINCKCEKQSIVAWDGSPTEVEACFENTKMIQPMGLFRAAVSFLPRLSSYYNIICANEERNGQELIRALMFWAILWTSHKKEMDEKSGQKTGESHGSKAAKKLHPSIIITTDHVGGASILAENIKKWFPFVGVYCMNDEMIINGGHEVKHYVLIVTANDVDRFSGTKVISGDLVNLYINLKADRYANYLGKDKKNLLQISPGSSCRRLVITRTDDGDVIESITGCTTTRNLGSIIHLGPTICQQIALLDEFDHLEITGNEDWTKLNEKWLGESGASSLKRIMFVVQSDEGFQDLQQHIMVPALLNMIQYRRQMDDDNFRCGLNRMFLTNENNGLYVIVCMYFALGNFKFPEIDAVFIYGVNTNFSEFLRQCDVPTKRLIVLTSKKAKDESNGKFTELKQRVDEIKGNIALK